MTRDINFGRIALKTYIVHTNYHGMEITMQDIKQL